jgi:ornithine cyclodeaminase/alanine dehydrogenase-like protein (mu-crystallin family)
LSECLRGADIVTTVAADKRNANIVSPPMIVGGMHLNAVGGDGPGKTELSGRSGAASWRRASRSPGEMNQVEKMSPSLASRLES